MNIIFMLGAIVGLLIYFFYRKETGTYVILAAMVVKFFEAALRMMPMRQEDDE
jgi:ABC-type phosphate/phosphonate transport system permease subunit